MEQFAHLQTTQVHGCGKNTPPVFLESCWIKDDVWGMSIIAPPTQSSLMHQPTQCYKYGLCLLEKRAAVRAKLPLRPTCTTFYLSTRPPLFWEQKHDLWMFVIETGCRSEIYRNVSAFPKSFKSTSDSNAETCFFRPHEDLWQWETLCQASGSVSSVVFQTESEQTWGYETVHAPHLSALTLRSVINAGFKVSVVPLCRLQLVFDLDVTMKL